MTDFTPPFDNAWLRFAFGFIIGATLGSFGTMLVYRLPRRISIIMPRSHCPSCKTTLRARDLIPLLSWFLTHGKCRYCHAKIGIRYIWIEVVTSLVCGLVGIVL